MFLALVCNGAMPLVSSATKFISDRLELSDGINCSERRGNVCVPVFVAVASLCSVWVYFILSLDGVNYTVSGVTQTIGGDRVITYEASSFSTSPLILLTIYTITCST